MEKIDFRRGNKASLRTVEAINAIREVLSQGDATFGALLEKTGLSRRALTSNLKKLLDKREVKRWVDEKDRRLRYYSLDDLGWKQYRGQKVSQILRNVELTPLGCIMDIIKESIAAASTTIPGVIKSQEHMLGESDKLPQLTRDEEAIFINCLQGKVYVHGEKNERITFLRALKEYLAITKIITARRDIDIRLFKALPDIVFEFKISKDKLIELYENYKKVGEYMLTSDFIQLCRSMNEKDFAEFLKTLGTVSG
jgi:DNA-binding MarR family transcriptional regulator